MEIPINEFDDLIRHCFGQSIEVYDDKFLQQAISKAAESKGFRTVADFLDNLNRNPLEKHKFLQSLRVGYSAFYREPFSFAVLDFVVLPEIISRMLSSGKKEIRIWSAACAAGQEAYTLAMLMEKHLTYNPGSLSYRIFATDANPEQITLAKKGLYTESSLDNLPLKMVNTWFDKNSEGLWVKNELKEKIDFSVFDLLDPGLNSPPASIFGTFDLIICANLLFYYNLANRKLMMDKIKHSLTPEGVLITGETEISIIKKFSFRQVFQNVPVFKLNNSF